jgi:hypothetical protein
MTPMPFYKTFILTALAVVFAFSTSSADAGHRGKAVASCPALNAIDPDSDGRMTLGEAIRRGVHVFKSLNTDGDRTLEPDETHGRLSMAAFKHANPDGDGSLSKGEWLRRIIILFNKANPDRDGTIECDELSHGYGRGLYRMLR